MKFFLLFSIFPLLFLGCGTTNLNYTGEVTFVAEPSEGVILVSSSGYGTTEMVSISDAEKNAIQIILFKGLPETKLEIPLIENESNARANNEMYFDKLLEEKEYKKFIISTIPKLNPTRVKGGYKTEQLIQINHNSMKKDLEQNNVIRKFGY